MLHPADREENSLLKSPNFVVPFSVVQDPGIKGALFQEDCCQLFVARNVGLCASPVRCTHVAGSENTSNGHGNVGVSKLSRAWRGCQDALEDNFNRGSFEHSIENHDGDGALPLLRQRDRLALRRLRDLGVGEDVRAGSSATAGGVGEDVRAGSSATAGESNGIIGLRNSSVHISRVSNSLNSSVGVVMSACASAACALPAAAAPRSWSTVARLSDAVVAHAHASPMHRARNSGGTGGLLPVQRSTSYCLRNSWSDTVRVQGPTGTRRVKGGVSRPAEVLLPVTEVEAGGNFLPAGGVRGQVAGSISRRQPRTGTRRVREGAVTPSLHPEVPGIHFVSPGYGLDIRQSMGWTKVYRQDLYVPCQS